MKNRRQKEKEYQEKYGNIPVDYEQRLRYMIDMYNLSPKKMDEIIEKRNRMLDNLFFYECKVVQLLEVPEGSARPRFVKLTKRNYNRAAMGASDIRVYTPNAADDHNHMKKLCDEELVELDRLISTPCSIVYDAFLPTPSYMSTTDVFLSEIGLIRPPDKPDWDNIGKKYCDMYNHNVWLDDAMVYDGCVHKYYSILPRIEISLKYINAVYTKRQYDRIVNRKDYNPDTCNPVSYLDRFGRLIEP